jgi:hypothetical protein
VGLLAIEVADARDEVVVPVEERDIEAVDAVREFIDEDGPPPLPPPLPEEEEGGWGGWWRRRKRTPLPVRKAET